MLARLRYGCLVHSLQYKVLHFRSHKFLSLLRQKGDHILSPLILKSLRYESPLKQEFYNNLQNFQILIRFALDRGIHVIPKSVTPSRIESNSQVFDFKLTSDEIQQIKERVSIFFF